MTGKKINEKKKDSRESQKKAAANYNRENVVQIKFAFNKRTDADIIEHLQPMYNKTAYIKKLIRDDIEKGVKKIDNTGSVDAL